MNIQWDLNNSYDAKWFFYIISGIIAMIHMTINHSYDAIIPPPPPPKKKTHYNQVIYLTIMCTVSLDGCTRKTDCDFFYANQQCSSAKLNARLIGQL